MFRNSPTGQKSSKQTKIEMLHKSSISAISKKLLDINNFMKNPKRYNKKHAGDPRPKLTPRDDRAVVNAVSNQTTFVAKVKDQLKLLVHRQTVWKQAIFAAKI